MKFITYILSGIFIIALSNSCTSYTYYYSMMEGVDPYIYQNEKSEFVIESDSIDVIYNFHGQNAPITVGIYNRKSTPVYVDWRESGVIIDGQTSMFREPLDANVPWGNAKTSRYARFLNDPEGMTLIKGGHRRDVQVLELANFNFSAIPDSMFILNNNNPESDSENLKLKSILYGTEDSPIYLGTFLTIYERADDMSEALIFEADFYMSELIQGKKTKPSSIKAYKDNRGDIFYAVRKKDTFWGKAGSTSLKILGGTAVITGNIILWALGDNFEE